MNHIGIENTIMKTLTTADIIVFFLTIVVTVGVGVVHRIVTSKKEIKHTKNDINQYLLGGNQNGPLLTGLSICASMISSIGLSVIPAEIVEGGVFVLVSSTIALGLSYVLIQIYRVFF